MLKRSVAEIVFTKPRTAEFLITDREPVLGPNQVGVEVVYTLISTGTERDHLLALPNTGRKFPRNAGYSSVGYVRAMGDKVKNLTLGDRVFVRYGGHASYCVKDRQFVVKIPEGVSFSEAVFTGVASFPLAAVRRARVEIGESVVVVGLGMLGLFAVQFARLSGANPLIAIGNRDVRREYARQFGAQYVLDSYDENLVDKVLDITGQETVMRGANVVIETSGSEAGLQTGLKYTARHARVMINGCNRVMNEPTDFYRYVHLRGVQLVGVHGQTRHAHNSAPGNWTAQRDYFTVLHLLSAGKLEAESLVSRIENPRNASDIYMEMLESKEFPLGVLFDWREFNKLEGTT